MLKGQDVIVLVKLLGRTEPVGVRQLAATTDLPPVWPHALGKVRGLVFEPLHPMVPAPTEQRKVP